MAAEANAVSELKKSLTALYVGDLDGSVTEEDLRRLFSQACDVVSVKLCVDEINQRSLGIIVRSVCEWRKRTKSMDNIGASAEANVVSELAQSLTAFYVGDLDGSVTEEDLRRLFGQAGDVVSVKLCVDEINQRSLGYGYVNYSNPDHAEKALEDLNFTRLNGRCIRIAYSNREGSMRKSGQGGRRRRFHQTMHG